MHISIYTYLTLTGHILHLLPSNNVCVCVCVCVCKRKGCPLSRIFANVYRQRRKHTRTQRYENIFIQYMNMCTHTDASTHTHSLSLSLSVSLSVCLSVSVSLSLSLCFCVCVCVCVCVCLCLSVCLSLPPSLSLQVHIRRRKGTRAGERKTWGPHKQGAHASNVEILDWVVVDGQQDVALPDQPARVCAASRHHLDRVVCVCV